MKSILFALLLFVPLCMVAQERDEQEELFQRTIVHPALDSVFNLHPLYAEAVKYQRRGYQGRGKYMPLEKIFILKNEFIGFNYELIKFEEECEIVPINAIIEHRIEHYIEFTGFKLMKDNTLGAVSFVYRYPELFHVNNQALYGSIYFEKDENGLWKATDHYLRKDLYKVEMPN